ncbi:DUF1553 domain-containing protein [Thalassoroseus pseudoceratinae]|uniref:DUF1553 domain-containing protein n=1 Tax=Thalassoroseus pseudoceratinae TaxID=2713176 RepID=UPI00142489D6|nr:DUF1553 domain-containing protein [Thalassoroseus pseudoceratinae]
MMQQSKRFLAGFLLAALLTPNFLYAQAYPAWAETTDATHQDALLHDSPDLFWDFSGAKTAVDRIGKLEAKPSGAVRFGESGPRPPHFPKFSLNSSAIGIDGNGVLKVSDPGDESILDFQNGDTITIEAWVNPTSIAEGQHAHIVCKGRTNRKGFPRDNLNYALRLTRAGGTARLSFLFRSAGKGSQFHRWTSDDGFILGSGWHQVACTYTFGEPDSLSGMIDGRKVKGKWDLGGKTTKPPVVDNDELWIGSAMGPTSSSTFHGKMAQLAIYRRRLETQQIARRYSKLSLERFVPPVTIPDGKVLVEITEGIPDRASWDGLESKPQESYVTNSFAFREVPRKYNRQGLITDRTSPLLLKATGRVVIPEGEHRLLLRARNGARLWIDGQQVTQAPFHRINTGGHGRIRDVSVLKEPGVRPLQVGDNEVVTTIKGDGKSHTLRLEMYLGGRKRRPELGETSVSLESAPGTFIVLSPTKTHEFPLTDEGWTAFRRANQMEMIALNAERRQSASEAEDEYWRQRHEHAKFVWQSKPSPKVPEIVWPGQTTNEIDQFINHALHEAGKTASESIDDMAFLRRVTLDVIGTIPTLEQIEEFQADQSPERRANAVDRLLQHPGWADHWVGYWQDVLAENPSLLKPTLNNTGPFRFWIHEAFYDNKSFDRFATELIRMEGSQYGGGPKGFEMASQNDVPMAAKAHVIGKAFLGLEMKCARCHDAPFHDFEQRDLFSLAAMLARKSQSVPSTSRIPGTPDELENLIVQVTIAPGEKIKPEWPFDELSQHGLDGELSRAGSDTRGQVAEFLTSPENERFAQVIVNRLWQRYLGRGLVDPVDDWQDVEPSHPELLDFLARELVLADYDLKHVARLILNSHTYQRSAYGGVVDEPYLFAGPVRRQMSAEQILDSLFVACGKDLHAGLLTLDPDGAQNGRTFVNLGSPRRAWEFASLSNERDRPSLSLPMAQDFTDLLKTFGWRPSRAEPITVRDVQPTVLQPGILANGVIGRRFTRMSSDSAFTELALKDVAVDEFIDSVYLRTLTREPTPEERIAFRELLSDGFEKRVRELPANAIATPRPYNRGVSWSNHLSEDANSVMIDLQKAVVAGDPPTKRLDDNWRARAEDLLWSMINTPEFIFVP